MVINILEKIQLQKSTLISQPANRRNFVFLNWKLICFSNSSMILFETINIYFRVLGYLDPRNSFDLELPIWTLSQNSIPNHNTGHNGASILVHCFWSARFRRIRKIFVKFLYHIPSSSSRKRKFSYSLKIWVWRSRWVSDYVIRNTKKNKFCVFHCKGPGIRW